MVRGQTGYSKHVAADGGGISYEAFPGKSHQATANNDPEPFELLHNYSRRPSAKPYSAADLFPQPVHSG